MSKNEKSISKTINLNLKDGFAIIANFSNISGSINQAYSELKSSFDVKQNHIAEAYNLDNNIPYLKQIADAMNITLKLTEEQRDLALKQRDTAIKDYEKQLKFTYISIGVAVVAVVVTIVVAFI